MVVPISSLTHELLQHGRRHASCPSLAEGAAKIVSTRVFAFDAVIRFGLQFFAPPLNRPRRRLSLSRIDDQPTFSLVDDHTGFATNSANDARDPINVHAQTDSSHTGQLENPTDALGRWGPIEERGKFRGDRQQSVLTSLLALGWDPQHRTPAIELDHERT